MDVFVGVDWGCGAHAVCVIDAKGQRLDRFEAGHDRDGLAALILRLMKRINRKAGTTFVFSTHDQKVINMADRLIVIEDGRVRRLGINAGGKWIYADDPDRRTPA